MAGKTLTPKDLKLSRKMQKIARKVEELVQKEMDGEPMGFGIVVFPWAEEKSGELVEFQYTSNAPRHFMHGMFKALVKGWNAGQPDVPPHERQ